jgi:hypothetical protein
MDSVAWCASNFSDEKQKVVFVWSTLGAQQLQPPAIAPTIRKGSSPFTTGNGSGVSGGSRE